MQNYYPQVQDVTHIFALLNSLTHTYYIAHNNYTNTLTHTLPTALHSPTLISSPHTPTLSAIHPWAQYSTNTVQL